MLYDVPSLLVRNYVQRGVLFSRLENLLERSGTPSIQRIVVLLGMGGIGKTQLALRYCEYAKSSRKYQAVFWLDASSQNTLYLSMETIAKKLSPDRILDDANDAVPIVRDLLSSWSDRWLLVFDNLDNLSDLEDIRKFFPDSNSGSILITSRCSGSEELGDVIKVDKMEENEGLQLLFRTSRTDTEERATAQDILTRLDYLPLAIEQVRAYTSYRKLPLKTFLDEYERRKREFMSETPRFSSYLRMLPDNLKLTTLNVMTTWEMSINLLDVGQDPNLKPIEILTVFAFFHPVKISEKLFCAWDETNDRDGGSPLANFMENGEWNHQKFERAVVGMEEQSLLQFSRGDRGEIVVTLHS